MSCRGWNSLDVGGCEADFIDPSRDIRVPVYWPQHQVNAYVQSGMDEGLKAARLQSVRVELVEALGVCLQEPDAVERWLRGDEAFEGVVDEPR